MTFYDISGYNFMIFMTFSWKFMTFYDKYDFSPPIFDYGVWYQNKYFLNCFTGFQAMHPNFFPETPLKSGLCPDKNVKIVVFPKTLPGERNIHFETWVIQILIAVDV